MSVPPPQTAPLAPPPPEPTPHVADGFAWWSPFVAYFVTLAATLVFATILAGITGHAGSDDLPAGVTLGATFIQDILLVVAMVGFAKLTAAPTTPAAFGLRRPRPGWGTALYVLALMVVFYGFLQLWSQLDSTAKDDLASDLGAKDSTLALIAVIVLVAVVAPVVEELFFRGFLFGALSRVMHWGVAALAAGAAFGLVHAGGTPLFFLVPLMLFGAGLCVVYRQTTSLLPGMGVHAFNNALALAVSLEWTAGQLLLAVIAAPLVVVTLASRFAD